MQSKNKMQKSGDRIWSDLFWPILIHSNSQIGPDSEPQNDPVYNANMPRFSMYTMYQGHHLSFHVLIYTKQIIDRGWIGLTLVLQVSGNRQISTLQRSVESICDISVWSKMVEQPPNQSTNQLTDDANHRASSVAKDLLDKPSCNDSKT